MMYDSLSKITHPTGHIWSYHSFLRVRFTHPIQILSRPFMHVTEVSLALPVSTKSYRWGSLICTSGRAEKRGRQRGYKPLHDRVVSPGFVMSLLFRSESPAALLYFRSVYRPAGQKRSRSLRRFSRRFVRISISGFRWWDSLTVPCNSLLPEIMSSTIAASKYSKMHPHRSVSPLRVSGWQSLGQPSFQLRSTLEIIPRNYPMLQYLF